MERGEGGDDRLVRFRRGKQRRRRPLGILVLAGRLLLLLLWLVRRLLLLLLMLLLMLRYRGLARLRRDFGTGEKEGSRRGSTSRAGALVVG